jgi:cytochrome b involved in lipid metabolism
MKNIIYILVAIVVVAAGGFVWYEKNEESQLQEFLEKNNTNTAATTTTASSTLTNSASAAKLFSMEEVSKHSTRTDCWMAINGAVLDVSTFVDKHPGGDRILQGCGKDATGYFNKVPGHMRSVAQSILNKLKIGDLAQ